MALIALTLLFVTGSGLAIVLPVCIYVGLVFYINPIVAIMGFAIYIWAMLLNIGYYRSAEWASISCWIDALMSLIIFVFVLIRLTDEPYFKLTKKP